MGGSCTFCGRCGHQLKLATRFCGNCGHPVPQNNGRAGSEDSPTSVNQAPEASPAYTPTIMTQSVHPVARQTAAASPPRDFVLPGMASRISSGPENPPPPPAQPPPGSPPPHPRPSSRTARPHAVGWPLAGAAAVLLIAGGTVAGLLLVRHAGGQRAASTQGNTSTRVPTARTTPPSPVAAQPPTQLDIQGLTIGIGAVNTDPNVTDVAAVIGNYFAGIDAQNYLQAWNLYTPALQAVAPFQPWSSALSTTQDSQIAVQSIQHDAAADVDTTISFQSRQAPQYGPNQGETCTNWSLDYRLIPSNSAGSAYLIDKVTPIGAGHTAC